MKAGSKRLHTDISENITENDSKKSRPDEEAEIEVEEVQLFGSLVTHMMEIETFFRLSMEEDNELAQYFVTAPEDYETVKDLSRTILGLLKGKKMEHYRLAFDHMMLSQGYSMLVFLQANKRLGLFLENHIDTLDAIFLRYLQYTKMKLEAELAALSETDESHYVSESSDEDKLFWQLPINSATLSATRENIPDEIEFPEDFKPLLRN